jgi:uncharacterized protein YciI
MEGKGEGGVRVRVGLSPSGEVRNRDAQPRAWPRPYSSFPLCYHFLMVKTEKQFILFYDLADDYLARRESFRADHLALAAKAYRRGEVLAGGALADPVDQAVLVFRSREAAESFAKSDPYVLNGLVREWRVRDWITVALDSLD